MSDEPADLRLSASPGFSSAPVHQDPQYRRLWTVGILVGLIRWVEILAFAVFTYERTHSELWVASLMTLRMLPLALFGVSLGALAARVSRRMAMLAMHVSVSLVSLVLLLLSWSGQIEVWHLAAASFLGGVLWLSLIHI